MTWKSFGAFLLLFAASQKDADEVTLVLTREELPAEQSDPYGGIGGIEAVLGKPIQWRNLLKATLALVDLDKKRNALGEEFSYQVVLQNITQEPVLLPWSADWRTVGRGSTGESAAQPPPGYLRAWLVLEISDIESGEVFRLKGISLHGSEAAPGSLRGIHPGQKARITVPSRWVFSRPGATDRLREKLPGTFEVRARFDFTYTRISNQRPYYSENSLRVDLEDREH